jgi:hypothetical protein
MTFRLKRFAGIGLLVLLFSNTFSSCDKYSSPRKVERFLAEGRWTISSAFIDNVNVTSLYTDVEFRFDKEGNIEVVNDPTISGKWTTSAQSNPTAISFTFTPFEPFSQLNTDWTFTLCTEERMELEQDGVASKDLLILDKLL